MTTSWTEAQEEETMTGQVNKIRWLHTQKAKGRGKPNLQNKNKLKLDTTTTDPNLSIRVFVPF